MKDYQVIQHGGVNLHTGCLVADVRTFTAPPLASVVETYTRSQVMEIITDPSWKTPRDIFPPETWIFNQGSVGSCNFYAAKGCLMRARELRGHEYVELSAEFGYANTVDGRDHGSTLDSSMRFIQEAGLCPMKRDHWQRYHKRFFSPEDYAAAQRFKGFELYEVDNELELATALINGYFCNIAVHVGRSFMQVDSHGRISGDSGPGNHAVCVHGVTEIDGRIEFDHAGSWGRNLHQEGYGYLNWSRNDLQRTRSYHPFWAMRAVSDDAQGDNPTL